MRVTLRVLAVVMMAALLVTMSCAKKSVMTDPSDTAGVTDTQTAEQQAAAEAAALEKQKAEEAAQRLHEQSIQEAAAAERQALRQAFENEDVLFDYDSAVLTWEAQQTLKDKARWMMENSGVNVVIQGHCDERGTTEYNLALGERRANAVKLFLMDLGISGARMTTISYGEEKPLDPGHDETAWRRNRRAHFVVL